MSSAAVTKDDLDRAMSELRAEMHAMEARLTREIAAAVAQVANVMMEHIQSLIAVVDDKYRDLPPSHARLRHDFTAHATDRGLHTPLAPAAPRRARRSRAR